MSERNAAYYQALTAELESARAGESAALEEVSRLREIRVSLGHAVREATTGLCSCGGKGPDDGDACVACLYYHAIDGFDLEYGSDSR